jgi:hypothetical protein
MGSKTPRELSEFSDVLSAVSRLPRDLHVVLVGGHAVNAWAIAFESRIRDSLIPLHPLKSDDLDLCASRSVTLLLHQELGGKLVLGDVRQIIDGRLVLGSEPDTREIDVLRGIFGVLTQELKSTVPLIVAGHEIQVLAPHVLLKGKLANLLHLDQTNRNDGKHVELMLLVLREFLADSVATAAAGNERAVLGLLKDVLDVLNSADGREFCRRFGRSFADILPSNALNASTSAKIQRFAKEYLPRHQST